MRIQVEKFLALTALLAAGSALSVGCVTESTDTTTDASVAGGGGSGGSTGGSGGAAGAAGGGGVAGGGGSAGSSGGAAGEAGTDAGEGGACLGDTGTEIVDCTQLPYAATTCGDAGAEGALKPLGFELCLWVQGYGRLGIQQPMWDCLKAITGDPCNDATAQKCVDDIFPTACERGPIPDGDGGTYDVCASVAASCTGTAGVTEAECDAVINTTSAGAADFIWTCYEAGAGACADDFYNCVGLP